MENIENTGGTTSFVYNYQGSRIKKRSGQSGPVTVYVGKLLEEVDGISITHRFAGGRRIASKSGAEIFYYHPDHLGSLNVATDADGAEVQRVTYYPFGEIRTNTGSIDLAYKFTGQEYDSETGLYYYGARYYDPAIGRFITPDSIVQAPGDPQALNRYAYARNNPLLYVDPTGHFFEAFLAFIGMLAGGAALGAAGAALNGQDPGLGAASGAISALGFMAAHYIIATGGITGVTEAAAMVHAGVGAATGAINAAITGGDAGLMALTGGVSGGISRAMGGILPNRFATQLGGRMLTGAVSGGFTAVIVGGDFKQGMFDGAWTAGFGYFFNCALPIAGYALYKALVVTGFITSSTLTDLLIGEYLSEDQRPMHLHIPRIPKKHRTNLRI